MVMVPDDPDVMHARCHGSCCADLLCAMVLTVVVHDLSTEWGKDWHRRKRDDQLRAPLQAADTEFTIREVMRQRTFAPSI